MTGTADQGGPGATAPGPPDPFRRSDPPVLALRLWPHRSLSRRGFARFLLLTAFGLSLPLVPLIGTKAAWGLLPFLAGALLAIYVAICRNYADARLVEELRLWPDLITVERREPRGAIRRWHANPFWVTVRLVEDAKVEKYLTLEGKGREIELGAFLTPEERVALHGEITAAIEALREPVEPA